MKFAPQNLNHDEPSLIDSVAPDAFDPASPLAPKSALEKIVLRFGGRQKAVAMAAERREHTVSGWHDRGLPFDAAVKIVDAAPGYGVRLTLAEVAEWMAADIRNRWAGGRA